MYKLANLNIFINIDNFHPTEEDFKSLFNSEDYVIINSEDAKSMPNLLKTLRLYKSTSMARRANKVGDIPKGFTPYYKATKKVFLCIWNPII